MASSGKKKTTMAKLMRESKLRERRLDKQAKKDARKNAPADQTNWSEDALNAAVAPVTEPDGQRTALETGALPEEQAHVPASAALLHP
jgi:hypothetical protein